MLRKHLGQLFAHRIAEVEMQQSRKLGAMHSNRGLVHQGELAHGKWERVEVLAAGSEGDRKVAMGSELLFKHRGGQG